VRSSFRCAGALSDGLCRALRGALAHLRGRNDARGDPSAEVAFAWQQRDRKTRVYARLMEAGIRVDGHVDWVLAHEELERLAKERADLDGREGLALLRASRAEVHRHLGYASFPQYVERLFGYGFRTTEDKLRTALALERLPELRAALCEGSLPWCAVREVARVATPETEHEWLEAARGKTVRQIERLVSGREAGDRPSEPGRPEMRRHVLRFEVSAQTYATFREAVAAIRRRSSEPMDDDALLLQVAREILRGPSDTGRCSYQVAVTICERCRQGVQHGAGT